MSDNKIKMTSQEVYERLLKVDKILELKGQIKFFLGDVSIVVKQKDVIGNIIQEWLEGWLKKNNIEFATNPNSQMPPDFYLSPDDRTKNLLEVKAFNCDATPGFDIADFRMYVEELVREPYMLDVDYLIFGYKMSDDGYVTIKKVWLQKVWQITRRMANWPINLQVKKKVVHKIRPGVWYSNKPRDFKIFSSLEDFVSALDETNYRNPSTREIAGEWRQRFETAYKKFYGKKIVIPRWNEIEDGYKITKSKK